MAASSSLPNPLPDLQAAGIDFPGEIHIIDWFRQQENLWDYLQKEKRKAVSV
jgi:hypothetical protein